MSTKMEVLYSKKPKYQPSRPLDCIYDPEYVVSSCRDFDRSVMEAARTEAEFKLCPMFATMFSDAYPRNMMVLKQVDFVPPWIDKSWNSRLRANHEQKKEMDVAGVDRHRFFRRPMVPFLQPVVSSRQFSAVTVDKDQKQVEEPTAVMQNCGTQTDYRESETQTSPWAPSVLSLCVSPPEVLTLANFSWDHGLPAGMHEVKIIERARKKREWEKIIPTSIDPKSIEKMRNIIDTIERDEWLFREEEIQVIHDMRLDLSRQLIEKSQQEQSQKLNDRLLHYWTTKQEEKNKKIQKIRLGHERELRKLALKHKGVNMKYHKVDVVEEHRDHKSELYGPQMRFGEHPKHRHEAINVRSRFLTHIKGLEILETVPKVSQPSEHLTTSLVRKQYELCIRETRWTEAVLKQLHHNLKDVRMKMLEEYSQLRLITRIPKPIPVPETPGTEGVPDREEDIYQGAVFLQKIIRGRAIQTLMCKGRRECQQLIEELKSTTALQKADIFHIAQEQEHVLKLQREHMSRQREEGYVAEILDFLQGHTISFMLDFLSKELWRLQDERRAHAFALLAERERCKREAAEAGRRQAEERRRKEHDEIFKQVVKVHQDTVDLYLEDVILESMDWVADAEARHHVKCLAQKIDQAAAEFHLRQNDLEQEELVADLIHNFVVPEVQKELIRKQLKQRQAKYLQEAHASLYDHIESLPPTEHVIMEFPLPGGEEEKRNEEIDTEDHEATPSISDTHIISKQEEIYSEKESEEIVTVEDGVLTFKPGVNEEEQGEIQPIGHFQDDQDADVNYKSVDSFTDLEITNKGLDKDKEAKEEKESEERVWEEFSIEKDKDFKDNAINVGYQLETEDIGLPAIDYRDTEKGQEVEGETEATTVENELPVPLATDTTAFKEVEEGKKIKFAKQKYSVGFDVSEGSNDNDDEVSELQKTTPKIGFKEPEDDTIDADHNDNENKPKSTITKRTISFK